MAQIKDAKITSSSHEKWEKNSRIGTIYPAKTGMRIAGLVYLVPPENVKISEEEIFEEKLTRLDFSSPVKTLWGRATVLWLHGQTGKPVMIREVREGGWWADIRVEESGPQKDLTREIIAGEIKRICKEISEIVERSTKATVGDAGQEHVDIQPKHDDGEGLSDEYTRCLQRSVKDEIQRLREELRVRIEREEAIAGGLKRESRLMTLDHEALEDAVRRAEGCISIMLELLGFEEKDGYYVKDEKRIDPQEFSGHSTRTFAEKLRRENS